MFELTEFHDARLAEVRVESPNVRLRFSHFVCFAKTATANVFDVLSAEVIVSISGCTTLEISTQAHEPLMVSDGHLTLDGSLFELRGDATLEGRGECELVLTDGGRISVHARRIEVRFGEAKFFETWRGRLVSRGL